MRLRETWFGGARGQRGGRLMACDPGDGQYTGIPWTMKAIESNKEGNLI